MLIFPKYDLRFRSAPYIKPLPRELFILVLPCIEHLAEPVNLHSLIELNFPVHAEELYERNNGCLPVCVLQVEILDLSDNFHPLKVNFILFSQVLGHVLWVDRHFMFESLFLLV